MPLRIVMWYEMVVYYYAYSLVIILSPCFAHEVYITCTRTTEERRSESFIVRIKIQRKTLTF